MKAEEISSYADVAAASPPEHTAPVTGAVQSSEMRTSVVPGFHSGFY